jgi:hypothetical protein
MVYELVILNWKLKWIGKFELKVVNGLLGILIRDEVLV